MSKLISFLVAVLLVLAWSVTIFFSIGLINKLDQADFNKISNGPCGHKSISNNCNYDSSFFHQISGFVEVFFGLFYLLLGNTLLYLGYKDKSKEDRVINSSIFSASYGLFLLASFKLLVIISGAGAH